MIIKATYSGTSRTDLNKMPCWIGLFGVFFAVCGLSQGVPVDVLAPNGGAETRLIIPPELSPSHFEQLKDNSSRKENCCKDSADDESTPLNFLKATQNLKQNSSLVELRPTVVLEGERQNPIYITIPIYITTSLQPPQRLALGNRGEGAVASSVAGSVAMPAAEANPPAQRKLPEVPKASETPKEETPKEEAKLTREEIKKAFVELLNDAYTFEERPARGRGKMRRRNFVKTDLKKQ